MRAERKVTVELIQSEQLHNYRLIAEAVAKQFAKERNLTNGKQECL